MDACSASEESLLASLEADFPGWGFILSDKKRWWALRGPLPMDRLHEKDAFDCDTAEELRAALVADGWGRGRAEGSP
ncbi:hypothetical protein [Actinomadura logoneensis]|uniref:hypothetical protein n=1 Tax=Actinomadura logoneensis TaxID=2293572 RepID=UPI001314C2D7|nr:hypothetical protein [Actinomadura logoneensis]